jgi:hypothetical protein
MSTPRREPRRFAAFRLDAGIVEGLRFLEKRDGIGVSEQVRRALWQWLEQHGLWPDQEGWPGEAPKAKRAARAGRSRKGGKDR